MSCTVLSAREIAHPYQLQGKNFLLLTGRAILADDMGLGKTLQALMAVDESTAVNVVIVCPKTVKVVWRLEIEKWFPEWKRITVVSGDRKRREAQISKYSGGILIMNYEQFRMHYMLIAPLAIDTYIFDEAHKLKNRKTMLFQCVTYVICRHKLADVYFLTGTPIINRADEIWTLLNLIDRAEYRSYWSFVGRYMETKDEVYGAHHVRKIVGVRPDREAELRERLSVVMLRRLRDDVLDLPPLIRITEQVSLEGEQRRIYDEMRDKMLAKLSESEFVMATIVIAQITKLKQIALCHGLVKTPQVLEGAKYEWLEDTLDGTEEKVVVFSQYTDFLNLVVREKKWKDQCVLITGDVTDAARLNAVKQFQDPNSGKRICFASIGAGGEGITLTGASVVLFLDQPWAPTHMNQAISRVHRQGQTQRTLCKILHAKNTVDQYIEAILEEKERVFTGLIPVARIKQILLGEYGNSMSPT